MCACDFSPGHYLECLEKADSAGYKIAPVCDFTKFGPSERVLLLRHDVDLSLDYAYEMAEMEYSIGYQSTYYILPHSPTFSAYSPKGIEMIRFISEMDHEIGLQIDSRYHCDADITMLENITKKPIKTYAQHFPSLTQRPTVEGLTDARDISIKYISDSGRHWRSGCLCENIGDYQQMQCLTHPLWWMTETDDRAEALKQLLRNRLDEAIVGVNDFNETVTTYVRDELGLGARSDRRTGLRLQA